MRYAVMAAAIGAAACSAGPREVNVPPPEIRTVYNFTTARGTTRDVETIRTTFDQARFVTGSWEATWRALPAVYGSLGIGGSGVLNEEEHLFGRQYLQVRLDLAGTRLSRIVRCGSLFAGGETVNPVTLTVMTLVEPVPGGSEVRTWLDATSRDVGGSGSPPVQCGSTGWLEREIVRRLSEGVPAQ